MSITTKEAMDQLAEALKDPEYRYTWQANIAMAFKDQFNFSGHEHDRELVHRIANNSAKAFLEQISPTFEIGDLPGELALRKLHSKVSE